MNTATRPADTTTDGTTSTRSVAKRLLAGAGLALAVTIAAGGAAFATDDGDPPIVPVELGAASPHVEANVPIVPLLPEDPAPVDVPVLELPELPDPCEPWDPGQTATVHSDPDAGTVSVMISYAGDTAATCDTLFVVHSIILDEAMNPAGLLAEEHVSMDDLEANGGSVTVTVPIDPCLARVFTDGPEAFILADTTYGEGCPTDTTEPTEPSEPSEPTTPTEPTEPTTPGPGGELPATGSSSTGIALLGGVFIAAGLGLASAVRGTQVRNNRR